MGFFKSLLNGGGSIHKKIAPKELRKLGPKEIQPGGFDPAKKYMGFDATGEAFQHALRDPNAPRDASRLYAPPPGGISRMNPNGPSMGATTPLNSPGPNTLSMMPTTGGRTYTPNPFNASQAPIGPTGGPPPPPPPTSGANMGFTPVAPGKGYGFNNQGPIKPMMQAPPPPQAMPPPQNPQMQNQMITANALRRPRAIM